MRMPGFSPSPGAFHAIVYHENVKKYTPICKAFFTEKNEKRLLLLDGFAIIAGIIWIRMS